MNDIINGINILKMSQKESSKFLGIVEKDTLKKVAKYGLIAVGILGLVSLL